MGKIIGFQIYLCSRGFLAAGGILCAERQPDITGLPLERGCAGGGVENHFERERSEI